MCLIPTHHERLTAKHDILVWKVLEVPRTVEIGKRGWVSPYQRTEYEFGRHYHVLIGCRYGCTDDDLVIEEGLHAFTDKNVADFRVERGAAIDAGRRAFPAVIPAGSGYYVDRFCGEIASNHMVVFETTEACKAAHPKAISVTMPSEFIEP